MHGNPLFGLLGPAGESLPFAEMIVYLFLFAPVG